MARSTKRGPTKKRTAAMERSAGAPTTASVAELWGRIERWFGQHPELPLRLRPAASEEAIAAAEKMLGARFPDDFRASLLVHDGQDDDCAVNWLPHAQRLGSLESLVACWTDDRKYYDGEAMAERLEWLDRGGRVRQVHLHPKHIPFAGSRYWDYGRLLFDFVPGPRGTEGQVIAREDIDLVYVGQTFSELLARVATGLERGEIEPTSNL